MREFNHLPNLIDEIEAMPGQAAGSIARDTVEQMRENWTEGKDATGTPWQELAPATVAAKGDDSILYEEGDMFNDLGMEVNRSAGRAKIGFTSEESTQKAELHEHGVPERNLPARPIIEPASRYAASQADDVVASEVLRAITRALR